MERKYFKALNFDLDTHQLKEHYPGANYRQRMTTCAGSSNGIVFLTVKVPAAYRMISWQLLIYTI